MKKLFSQVVLSNLHVVHLLEFNNTNSLLRDSDLLIFDQLAVSQPRHKWHPPSLWAYFKLKNKTMEPINFKEVLDNALQKKANRQRHNYTNLQLLPTSKETAKE